MEFKDRSEVLEYLALSLLKFEIMEITAKELNAITRACKVLIQAFSEKENSYWTV